MTFVPSSVTSTSTREKGLHKRRRRGPAPRRRDHHDGLRGRAGDGDGGSAVHPDGRHGGRHRRRGHRGRHARAVLPDRRLPAQRRREEDPDGDESQRARLGLVFSHTPNYPEEPPLIKCRSLRGLFDAELVACKSMLDALAKRIGRHADEIFDLAQAAKEWMRDRAGVVDVVEETPSRSSGGWRRRRRRD